MLRKLYYFTSSSIIVILMLIILLLLSIKQENKINYSEWISQNDTFITTIVDIGDVKKTAKYVTEVQINENKFLTYKIHKNHLIKGIFEGKIIYPKDKLDINSEIIVDYLGRIEKIEFEADYTILTISDFSCLTSTVRVEQKYAMNIRIGDKVDLTIDDLSIKAEIINHSYKIVDGYLLVNIEYESNKIIYEGSQANVEFLISSKSNVLRVDKAALICENNKYYLNYLDGIIVKKNQVEIGLIGNDYVEIKNGIKQNTKVIINPYE